MGQAVSSASTQVFQDQVDYQKDMGNAWFWAPVSIGVVLIILAFVVLFHGKTTNVKETQQQENKPMTPDVKAGLTMLGIGTLLVLVPSLVLNVRHPAATVERMGMRLLFRR